MTLCQRSVLRIVLGAEGWSRGTGHSPAHILTFQQLHDRLTPAALQRSGWGPSARCPAAPPCSVGFGDGSGWPLQMVLPRQRPTEHHPHPTARTVHLASIFLPSGCRDAGVAAIEGAHHRPHTQRHSIPVALRLPTGHLLFRAELILPCGLVFVTLSSLRIFKSLFLRRVQLRHHREIQKYRRQSPSQEG